MPSAVAVRRVLEFQNGPTIVVGHSYGGQIVTALGANAPNVVGLVYIAAFALDEGESLGALLSQGPVTPARNDRRPLTHVQEGTVSWQSHTNRRDPKHQ